MRLALVAHAQHPLAEPYAGGLEVFTTQLVRGLRERGHHVVLYAATGTDPALADELVEIERSPLGLGPRPATVPSAPDPVDRPETRAYLGAAADIVARAGSLDLVANHSLQPTTMALSATRSPVSGSPCCTRSMTWPRSSGCSSDATAAINPSAIASASGPRCAKR